MARMSPCDSRLLGLALAVSAACSSPETCPSGDCACVATRALENGNCCREWFGPRGGACVMRLFSSPEVVAQVGDATSLGLAFDDADEEVPTLAWVEPAAIRVVSWAGQDDRPTEVPAAGARGLALALGRDARVRLAWEESGRVMTSERADGGEFGEPMMLDSGERPQLRADEQGETIVAWTREGQTVAMIRSASRTVEPEVLGPGRSPVALALASNGDAVAAWQLGDGVVVSERWRRGDPFTRPARPVLVSRGVLEPPVVAIDDSGRAVVATVEERGGVVVYERASDWILDRTDLTVDPLEGWTRDDTLASPGDASQLDAAFSRSGALLLAWVQDDELRAAYQTGEHVWEPTQTVSPSARDAQPRVVFGADGEAMLVWREHVDDASWRVMVLRRNAGPGGWAAQAQSLASGLREAPELAAAVGVHGRAGVAWIGDGEIELALVEH